MNTLIQGNAPWGHTGYSVPTRSLSERLVALGHNVYVFCFYGLHGGVIKFGNVTMLPPYEEPWGNDIIDGHIKHYDIDLLITMMDAWVLHSYGNRGTKWLSWCPIDHKDAPAAVVAALQTCHYPAPYTLHGEQALHRAGIAKAKHIHIGTETGQFYPDPDGRKSMRDLWGVPQDAFVMGMVANNRGYPLRKGFDTAFEAFAKFRKKHKNSYFYCHTNPAPGPDRPELTPFVLAAGLKMSDIIWPDPYAYAMGYPTAIMRHIYNAFDVLAVPSVGEGFLVPAIEQAACGGKVIATNCTSLPEVTCPDARFLLRNLYDKTSPQGQVWSYPTAKELLAGLNWAFQHRGDEVMARRARQFVVENFDWDYLFSTKWQPLLAEIEQEIADGRQGANREDKEPELQRQADTQRGEGAGLQASKQS